MTIPSSSPIPPGEWEWFPRTAWRELHWLYATLPAFFRKGKEAFKPGLERIARLLQYLGNPHHKIPAYVHVAGTNGKGYCTLLLGEVLRVGKGWKTGTLTSPHLISVCERIRIQGESVSGERIAEFVRDIRRIAEDLQATFFEVITACALHLFAQEQVDIAIVEVGMGGRLDATTIIPPPDMVLIPAIHRDHEAFLGTTISAIAEEKCGVIKPGTRCVISGGGLVPEAEHVIASHVRRKHVSWFRMTESAPARLVEVFSSGEFLAYHPLRGMFRGWGPPHQGTLFSEEVVYRAAEEYQVPQSAYQRAIRSFARIYPGRWHLLKEGPGGVIIADGSHNYQSFVRLGEALYHWKRTYPAYRRLLLVVGMTRDRTMPVKLMREWNRMFASVEVWRTTVPGNERMKGVGGWGKEEESLGPWKGPLHTVWGELIRQIHQSPSSSRGKTLILITGSLFLAGYAIYLLHHSHHASHYSVSRASRAS